MNGDFIGQAIANRYRIIEKIGSGGMGAVYKALDARLQRIVAVKILHSQLDDESERRLITDARVAARLLQLLRHPNIVTIFDFGKAEGLVYVVLEYIEGGTLAQAIAGGQSVDVNHAIEIIYRIGGALEYAHQHGLVHRDIKPSNILISTDGRVLLSDFELAVELGASTRDEHGRITGTPHYMSPEQAMGKRVDERSDIFSLGAVAYEMLTGVRAFSGASVARTLRNVVEQTPALPHRLNARVSGTVSQVILKALEKDPASRFQTMATFLNALEKAKESSGAQDTAPLLEAGFANMHSAPVENAAVSMSTDQDLTSTGITPYEPVRVPQRKSKEYPSAIAWLVVLDTPHQPHDERPHQFRLADSVTIGRDTDNDIVFFDYEVWHHHARISLNEGRFYITDLNSGRGTFVNGVRVERCELHDRDVIAIGERTMLFTQTVGPQDFNIEAERRLQEFDAIWDQLIRAAHND
jgi:serine/threonine protein kinase